MRQIHSAAYGEHHTGAIGHALEEAAAHTGAGSQQELQLWGDPVLQQGQSVRCKGQQGQSITNPLPHPPATPAERRGRVVSMNLSLGKRAEWGEGGFSFEFVSHYHTLFLI